MPAIVGRDPSNGDLGVAVESKSLAAGAGALLAVAGVGAIAILGVQTATAIYSRQGLDLMATGKAPEEIVQVLTKGDKRADQRQFAIVDAQGRADTFTGPELKATFRGWTDGLKEVDVAIVGGGLIGEGTPRLMLDTFQRTPGRLWDRLMEALRAGRHMGGDLREPGQHSAALLVVREGGGYGGFNDRLIDLRVDDDSRPVERLQELLNVHTEYFLPCDPADLVVVHQDLARELQSRLARSGDYHGWITGTYDAPTRAALAKFAARENLEERLQADGRLDPKVLARLGVRELLWREGFTDHDAARGK